MNPVQTSALPIILPLLAFALLAAAALIMAVRHFSRRSVAAVLKRFEGRRIHAVSRSATYFGLLSRSHRQLRGNGVLLLTDGSLYFQMWLSRRSLEIPLDKIVAVRRVRVFKSRSILRRLLRVDFTDENGRGDAAAWYVSDLPEWERALEALRRS